MPRKSKPTWRRYEDALAANFQGKRNAFSGARHVKLDVDQAYFKIDAKTCLADNRFTFSVDLWQEVRHHALMAGLRPMIAVLMTEGLSTCWFEYGDFAFLCKANKIGLPGTKVSMRRIDPTRTGNFVISKDKIREHLSIAKSTMPVFAFQLPNVDAVSPVIVGLKEENLISLMKGAKILSV